MNAFSSTRGGPPVPFAEALFQGLAPDGGLYVPTEVPMLGPEAPQGEASFTETSQWAARRLLGDAMEPDVLESIVGAALDFPMPLVEVEPDVWVLELFHGPSLAFKDVGARFMAHAMARLAEKEAGSRTVLVATSGDTGGAVADAFHGLDGYRVVVLFPDGGISERQRRQMTTLGGNVEAVAVAGTFDDCQRMAKGAFADEEVRLRCGLTSANSINIGRLVPQAFYYVHAAARLGWSDRPVTFVVPSGNLGNLCAGLLAQRAGMPTSGFVAASNRNRVFPDYLATGRYEPLPSIPTLSNAMDVGAPSNLERIRWLYGDDDAALRGDVRGIAVTDEETRACIGRVQGGAGYVLDPHGAVAWQAMEQARRDAGGVYVVLATAHPCKFPDVVEEVIGGAVPVPAALAHRMEGPERIIPLPAEQEALRDHLLAKVHP